jgi:hypothetical protein
VWPDVIAFVVRVHESAEGLAGVVEFPGAARRAFRAGDELIGLMRSWLDESAAHSGRTDATAGA